MVYWNVSFIISSNFNYKFELGSSTLKKLNFQCILRSKQLWTAFYISILESGKHKYQ